MKAFLVSASIAKVAASIPNDEYGAAFQDFEARFHKSYATSEDRESSFLKFKETYKYIASENAKGSNMYELGVNAFSDLTPEEFAKTYFGFKKPAKPWGSLKHLGTHEYSGAVLADSVDWVTKGAVTPIKNQGQCGSCWSFSTTGALEGAWQISTNKLVSLSEEQLVECSKQNNGCQGGSMDLAFSYEEGVNVCTENSYPYTSGGGSSGSCKASSCTTGIPRGGVTGYKDVARSEQALMEAITQQPVSIAVEADKSVFQSYKSGIMNGACGSNLDHGILAVGYGTQSGQDYWLVKNSWGTVWGEQGYGKLLRGKGGTGECGILSQTSYPVVSGSPGPSPGPSPPGPSPVPPPSPPSPSGSTHYEKPPCRSDEVDVQVQGLTGETCTPKCTGTTCPTDVPEGTTAKPSCVLQDSSTGDKYCALTCLIGGCPPGATCQRSGFMGLCMYPSSSNQAKKTFEISTSSAITV